MTIFSALISICWLVFVAYWFFSAFGAKRNVEGIWQWFFMRLLMLIIVFVIISVVIPNWSASLPFATTSAIGLNIFGVICCACGIALAVVARTYLGSNWGMPMSVKVNPELITRGPYAYIRHPIYAGVFLALIGTACVIGVGWFVIFLIYFIYFLYSAKIEERNMTKLFPNQYPEYRKRTKMLIPFVF